MTAPRTLLLIRHGETVWNAERRFTTHSDLPLSEVGVEQAGAAAAALAATGIDRVYSSPLQRARVTAEVIAAHQPGRPAVVADDRLAEIDAGPFEGMTEDQLRSGPMADDYARWHTNVDPEFPEGAETFDAALARASAFLEEHAGETGYAGGQPRLADTADRVQLLPGRTASAAPAPVAGQLPDGRGRVARRPTQDHRLQRGDALK